MTARSRWRTRSSSTLATIAAGLIAVSGAVLAPSAAFADSTEAPAPATATDATLDWGVKTSFRKYLKSPIADGSEATLGNVTVDGDGPFHWASGSGTIAEDATTADIGFGAGNGAHFEGHEMTVDGETGNALDLDFTNPRVVMTSATEGELRLDVDGREFISMTELGPEYHLEDVAFATLSAENAPVVDAGVATWTDMAATLTTDGADAFGGFYEAGEALDPVTVSTAIEVAEEPEPEPEVDPEVTASVTEAGETGLTVEASATGITLREAADVPDTGKADAGVYFAVIDETLVDTLADGPDAAAAVDFAYKMFIADGAVTRTLDVDAADLDRDADYAVVSWLAHGNLTDERLLGQTALNVSDAQWDAVFPEESGDNESGDNETGDNESGDNETGDNESGDNEAGDNESGDNESGDSNTGDSNTEDDGADVNTPEDVNGATGTQPVATPATNADAQQPALAKTGAEGLGAMSIAAALALLAGGSLLILQRRRVQAQTQRDA